MLYKHDGPLPNVHECKSYFFVNMLCINMPEECKNTRIRLFFEKAFFVLLSAPSE